MLLPHNVHTRARVRCAGAWPSARHGRHGSVSATCCTPKRERPQSSAAAGARWSPPSCAPSAVLTWLANSAGRRFIRDEHQLQVAVWCGWCALHPRCHCPQRRQGLCCRCVDVARVTLLARFGWWLAFAAVTLVRASLVSFITGCGAAAVERPPQLHLPGAHAVVVEFRCARAVQGSDFMTARESSVTTHTLQSCWGCLRALAAVTQAAVPARGDDDCTSGHPSAC